MAARMPCGSHKMIKWYEHWVITPFKMLKELIRSIDILFKIGNKRNIFVDITLKTRQSEMANTSPRHMPVLGNIHPIKI